MAAIFKFITFVLGFLNPVIKEHQGSNLPAALKVNWLKLAIILLFVLSSGYYIFGSDAPFEERQQQLEMIEELTEDALEMIDESGAAGG